MSRLANAAPPRWLVAVFLCFNFPLSALQPAQERNGFPLHPPDLRSRLLQALADKGSGYEPRTEHLEPNGSPRYTNRLILEQSPYLIQHAHIPVNWYPWSDEAFERARLENKPVFLSIGYSTCHWCHVMERESFDNEEIAELLNEKFICIKVDREQRPDLDEIYMTAVQLLTRHGGWPAIAQYHLGDMYYAGRGVAQDDREAIKWCRRSAEQGDGEAQLLLGSIYLMGHGVPQDNVIGHMWFNLATSSKSEDVSLGIVASLMMEMAAEEMTPAQITEAQKLAREWMEKRGK